ncbi:MAG TPA: hypothetical protein VE398_04095, partial [Acidobacteriota bacterium]|nr:hypothetical protein [Acidobacteriota bacterium]
LIRRILGLIAAGRGEGGQVYSHRKRRDNGWSLLRRGTRLLFGSVLLRDARLAAPASVIPNKPHDCEQDSKHCQGRCCHLNAAHYDRDPAQPGVLLEARRAANNMRNRDVVQAELPISIRHRS